MATVEDDAEPLSLGQYIREETREPLDMEAVGRAVENWLRSYADANCALTDVLEARDWWGA